MLHYFSSLHEIHDLFTMLSQTNKPFYILDFLQVSAAVSLPPWLFAPSYPYKQAAHPFPDIPPSGSGVSALYGVFNDGSIIWFPSGKLMILKLNTFFVLPYAISTSSVGSLYPFDSL